MSEQIDAIYDGGVLRPVVPLSLPDKVRVTLTIDAASPATAELSWSEFVEQTYGSCAGAGLERPAQGELEPRERIA
jgi:predicted DNA-binding antitoxin AbrB/MazE fold protein